VQDIGMSYKKRCDCDQINAKLKNLLVFDNTNYPQTLDPLVQYMPQDEEMS